MNAYTHNLNNDKECITIELLQIQNVSNYWGAIVIVVVLLSIVLTWCLLKNNNEEWVNTLKWTITGCLVLVGLFTIYSIYSTHKYFFKHGFSC